MSETLKEDSINNDQLVLVVGYSANGKSSSLRNIRNQENWLYLCTEAGKRLPFKNKFQAHNISDPMQVFEAFDYAADPTNNIKGVVLDSLTFLLEMYVTQYVLTATNTKQAWGTYNQFFKKLLQQYIGPLSIPVIITAHVRDDMDERTAEMRTSVPVSGALKGTGVEAYFTTVVAAKKMPIKDLEKMKSNLIEFTEEDVDQGFKYVFQTRITKNTTGERIRSPMGMFSLEEIYMDNDVQKLLDHLGEYYA